MELKLLIKGHRYNKNSDFVIFHPLVDKEIADQEQPSVQESEVLRNIWPSRIIKWKVRNYLKHSSVALSPGEMEKMLAEEEIILKDYQLYNCIKHLKNQEVIIQINEGKNKISKYIYNYKNKFEEKYELWMKK